MPSTHQTGAAAARTNNDEEEDNKRFDGTGLLVWPGSRLLASFLVDPSGACRLLPQVFTSGLGHRGATRPTAISDGPRVENVLAGEGQTILSSSDLAPGPCKRHNGPGDRLLPPHRGACLDQGFVLPEENRMALTPDSKVLNEQAPVVDITTREAAQVSPAMLELGAGTGVCSIAASLKFGCPVSVLRAFAHVLLLPCFIV